MTGTLINVATVLIGGTLGTVMGNRLPDKARETVMHGLGLVTITVGLSMALKTQNVLIVMFSVLFGGILGEWWGIEAALEGVGAALQRRFQQHFPADPALHSGQGSGGSSGHPPPPATRFIQGFVTASLVFCVGPMTVLGSIQDGLSGNYQLLAIKSLLDGFAALAFASSLGAGVLFSAVTVLIYQGALTLTAGLVQQLLTEPMITEMTATGGVLIMGIGLILLDLKRVRVGNFLPAIFIAPVIVAALAALHIPISP
jgi:uncharacterized membrane protein YqgA involved in biofilm formation